VKQPVKEDLRLSFFIGSDVFGAPRGERRKFGSARHGGDCARENGWRQFWGAAVILPLAARHGF